MVNTLPKLHHKVFDCFSLNVRVIWSVYICLSSFSCDESQPEFECSTNNFSTYQVRFYKQGNAVCSIDSGFHIDDYKASSAGLEAYVLITPDGGGGPEVVFRDVSGKLDRSATKLGLRINSLLSLKFINACNDNLQNDCAHPDPELGCRYCVFGDGGVSSPYTFTSGSSAEDVRSPNGERQGVLVLTNSGATKRISLQNACEPGKFDDVVRYVTEPPASNFFFMLPRYPVKGVCSPLNDQAATTVLKFPRYVCQDATALPETSIQSSISNFKLLSSATIQGTLAKGTMLLTEYNSAGESCATEYKLVIMNPRRRCVTDVDCSPVAVPDAPACEPDATTHDYCLSMIDDGRASTITGSGISQGFFRKFVDGGFDLRDSCDSDIKFCIWDVEAGI